MAAAAGRKRSIASTTTLQIDTPVAHNTLLNKSASQSTSLYQQCTSLRSQLLRIRDFAPYFVLASSSDSRQSTDPVTQLWDLFTLGIPLCFIFNLLDNVKKITTVDTNPDAFDVTNERARKRAIALFAMQIKQFEACEPFTVTDLWDRNSTDGLVKVINTVSIIVDQLPESAFEEIPPSPLSSIVPYLSSDSLPSDVPSTATTLNAKETARNNIVREIVETERKYVQDLEIMQKYSNALSQSNAMNQDTIHYLFPNLNKLLNFQRKFLIRLEGTAELPWSDQRWGLHFIENEEEFAVYEPYCANYTAATELMLANEQNLMSFSHLINAKSELPAFLIKPVQRICKYPLLLESLVKASSPAVYPHFEELKSGAAAAKRITDKINEAQRRAENDSTVKSLINRVEDWKGHHLSNFGELLLDDIFTVTKSEVDREYHVFLFEKIILCCKEAIQLPNGNGKRAGKSNSILKRQLTPNGQPLPGGPVQSRKRDTPLLLKGRIFLNNVTQAIPTSPRHSISSTSSSHHALAVWWRGDDDLEFFTLRCRNEEQMKLWEGQINRLIKEVAVRRASERAISRSVPHNSTNPAAPRQPLAYSTVPEPVYLNGNANNNQRRRSPYASEERISAIPLSSTLHPSGPHGYPPHDGFDHDDDEDDYEDYPPATGSHYPSSGRVTPNSNYAPSGRGTPMGGRRANAQSMPPEHDAVPGYDRPRARTEDTNGAVMAQWRNNGLPPPPPSAPHGLPGPSIRPTTPHVMSTPNYPSESSHGSGGWPNRPPLRNQYSSTKLQAHHDHGSRTTSNGLGLSSPSRSRSVSQPNSYVPKNPAPPPLPPSTVWPSQNSFISKRGSGSSQSTGESSDYSPNSSSPITPFGSSESSLGFVRPPRSNHFERLPQDVNPHVQLSPPIKVKVHFHEDIFVIQVPRGTEYAELVEKVGRKIRLCGPRRDDGPLRVKYKDEDGDMVSLGSTEDVQMAFEQYRPGGQVTLYVT